MTSRSRILANLNSNDVKSATHPSHNTKTSLQNAQQSGDVKASHRKTLHTFQPENLKATSLFSSLPPKTTLKKRGKENLPTKHQDEQKVKSIEADHGLKVYQDSVTGVNGVKKDDFNLICDEHASERYWEMLAEERRKALKIALEENKELANDIKAKEETIKRLQEEVTELKETVKHTEIITSVLENLLQANATPEDTELGNEGKDPDQFIGEAHTNAIGNALGKNEDKVGFEIKCNEYTGVSLEQSSMSNVEKVLKEDATEPSNGGSSNISGSREAHTIEYSQQEA